MNINEFIAKVFQQLGNDGKPYWNWYTDNVNPAQGYYVNGYATPYCAEFVSCMLLWNDVSCIYFPNSCAFDGRDISLSERYYGTSIQRGDIIAFDWDDDDTGDHVGIVADAYSWGCHTIEGNTGNDSLVMERDRYWDDILFAIRPNYDGSSIPHNNTNGGKLDVDGYGGYNTVLDMQNVLDTPKDGVISGQIRSNAEYLWAMCSVSWDETGSLMVQKMQEAIGANIDGYWGYQTSQYLQRYLIERDYSCGPSGVDGYFGNDSVKALQRYLNEGGNFA